jgi:hypothetical protein
MDVEHLLLCWDEPITGSYPIFLFGFWGYSHCGHSWPIVPASGIVKIIVEKQMECRLAGETEVPGQNLPQG